MQPDNVILPLTPLRILDVRFETLHRSRRIGIFIGPPGTGKSTAIHAFAARYLQNVVVITLNRKKIGSRDILRLMVQAIWRLRGHNGSVNQQPHMIAQQLRFELTQWHYDMRRQFDEANPRLTFIFDEAQYLAREAMDELRYWNDQPDSSVPVKIGLIFVGNHELSLKVDDDGKTVISRAVGDRARFIESMDYSEITNDDLALFAHSRGVDDAEAVTAIVRHFSTPRAQRSLRRVGDFIDDITEFAAGQPVTAEIIRSMF